MAPDKVKSFTPPSDPAELINWADSRFDEGSKLNEYQAKQNLAFVLGQQWGVWDSDKRRFNQAGPTRSSDPNAPVRVTVNKIGGLVERVISRLTKDIPTPECRPVSDTMSDVNAAKVGTRILDHELTARLNFIQLVAELYFWVIPLGWSFLHVRWDPKAGPLVGSLDIFGEGQKPVHQGEVAMEAVPAFELRIDPNARHFREARWCIREVAMTKAAVYEQYGKVPEVSDSDSLGDEWRNLAFSGDNMSTRSGKSPSRGGMVPVRQIWYRPGGRIKPKGLVFTWAGKMVLEAPKDFPYEHGNLPFVPFNVLPALGGSPEGRTWVTDLISMQSDYNDARSREATIRRTLVPKILSAIGQINPNRLTSRFEVVEYIPSGPEPKFMIPDGRWMAQYETAMNRADQEMGDRSGQQDVSQGKAASTAAAASIMALQEADETKLAISSREMQASIKEIGYQVLMLVKQFWDEERTVRTWSRDGQLEVSHFRGSDVGEQLDVHVTTESSLPRSKSARAQLAGELLQQGIITDPRDYIRILDLPGTDFVMETLNLDAKQAEREHGHLINMEEVEVHIWDNHPVHAKTHREYMLSEEFEAHSPEQQAWFLGHYEVHKQIEAQLAQAAAMGMPERTDPDANLAAGGDQWNQNPSGANGMPTDPLTGMPQDPNQMPGGAVPSQLQGGLQSANGVGGAGGAGNPGFSPVGPPFDIQAAHLGN